MDNHPFLIKQLEMTGENPPVRVVWLHGWGQDHRALLPLAGFFSDVAENYLIDLPGFGQSALPNEAWDSADYAKSVAEWLQTLDKKPTIIIGHSFGCRVGLQMAVQYPELVSGLILIAAPGLTRKRSPVFKVRVFALKMVGRILKQFDHLFKTSLKEKYANKVGSRDYRMAQGLLRAILVKSVCENLSDVAEKVQQPVQLIYGQNDNETPIEFGETYQQLIKNAELAILPNQDHYTVLSTGRYPVQNLIEQFIERIL